MTSNQMAKQRSRGEGGRGGEEVRITGDNPSEANSETREVDPTQLVVSESLQEPSFAVERQRRESGEWGGGDVRGEEDTKGKASGEEVTKQWGEGEGSEGGGRRIESSEPTQKKEGVVVREIKAPLREGMEKCGRKKEQLEKNRARPTRSGTQSDTSLASSRLEQNKRLSIGARHKSGSGSVGQGMGGGGGSSGDKGGGSGLLKPIKPSYIATRNLTRKSHGCADQPSILKHFAGRGAGGVQEERNKNDDRTKGPHTGKEGGRSGLRSQSSQKTTKD